MTHRSAAEPAVVIRRVAGLLAVMSCWCAAALGFGCGPVRPPPAAHSPSPPATASARAARAAPSHSQSVRRGTARPFRLLWRRQEHPFAKALAFTAEGKLLLLGSRRLATLDPRSGRPLGEREVCFTFPSALARLTGGLEGVVCEDGVQLFSSDRLEYRGQRRLDGRARGAAFGSGVAALAFESGPVRLFEVAGWHPHGELAVDQRPSAIALSAGARRLAIGLEHGELIERALGSEASKRVSIKRGLPISVLAYRPDGKALFAAAGPLVGVWRVPALELQRTFRTVGGVIAAAWLGPSTIATVGRDGLLLLDVDSGAARSVGGGWADSGGELVALAVSDDHELLCTASRQAEVICLSRGRMAAGVPLPVAPAESPAGERQSAGRVMSSQGRRLTVRVLVGEALPPPAVKLGVLAFSERRVGQIDEARWQLVGQATVVKIRGDMVHLTLEPGGPRAARALAYDAPVRLRWMAAQAEGDGADGPSD